MLERSSSHDEGTLILAAKMHFAKRRCIHHEVIVHKHLVCLIRDILEVLAVLVHLILLLLAMCVLLLAELH